MIFIIFYFIKSETSDSFVNHFDGHFTYLKTLDFNDFLGQVLGLFLSDANYLSGTGWGLFLTAMNNFWGRFGFVFNWYKRLSWDGLSFF